MANYIQLISKATDEPETFNDIDEKLCTALQVPCDTVRYYCGWYDVVGYSCRSSIQEVIERVQDLSPEDEELLAALVWLDKNYTLNAWVSR